MAERDSVVFLHALNSYSHIGFIYPVIQSSAVCVSPALAVSYTVPFATNYRFFFWVHYTELFWWLMYFLSLF